MVSRLELLPFSRVAIIARESVHIIRVPASYMYICIYVFMHICIYIYISVYIYLYIYIYIYLYIYIYIYIYMLPPLKPTVF